MFEGKKTIDGQSILDILRSINVFSKDLEFRGIFAMKQTMNEVLNYLSINHKTQNIDGSINDCVIYDFTTIEILVIDPGNYTPDIYYNCDSIEIKNKILKRFVLSLEDLKNSDFVVTYQ